MDISVAIGRNVGDQPMSGTAWIHYMLDVRIALESAGFAITCRESGMSTYGGTTEECERFFATVADDRAPRAYLTLRARLDTIRRENDQWGIALSLVKTDMVSDATI